MIVALRGSIWRLLLWQWRNTLLFTCSAVLVVLAYEQLELEWLQLPALPLAVVGGAIGIFVSFRTNSAYDRWWEGRKLWGRLINSSRHWGSQVTCYVSEKDTSRRLVRRHIAYVHSLRCLLRKQVPFQDDEFCAAADDPEAELKRETNLTHGLLDRQLKEVCALTKSKDIDEFQRSDLDLTIRHLLDIQGGCERIKKTPMPRGYGFIAERLVQYFSLLFPMTVVAQLGWWTVAINLLVCMAFALISEAGRVLEDPFTMFYNGLPLSAMSRTIERNLLTRMDTPIEDIPDEREPSVRGVLM